MAYKQKGRGKSHPQNNGKRNTTKLGYQSGTPAVLAKVRSRKWRHPRATSTLSATVTDGSLYVYSTSTDFEVTAAGEPHGYSPFRAWAVLHFGGDLSVAARAARHLRQEAGQ